MATGTTDDLELYRKELTGYCYRMLGSGFEAEDAVQETMLRAWKSMDSFEGRSALRSWVYRIATNVCLDMLRGSQRRARPMDLGPSSPADISHLGAMLHEQPWLLPVPDASVFDTAGDPAEVAVQRDSVRLAFVAALQLLPAKQRAVLIMREVFRWPAADVAEMLETTLQSVNSALQRARATLSGIPEVQPVPGPTESSGDAELIAQYVRAFEAYDVEKIVSLLHADVVQSMPPYAMWLTGAQNVGAWLLGPGIGCKGSRLLPTAANRCPAFGQYRIDPAGGHTAWGLQVLETAGGRITGFHTFLGPEVFELFSLPGHLNY